MPNSQSNKNVVNDEQVKKNMRIYDLVRKTPDNAKRPINEGRLRGKTDINPMWRIKILTEVFGPCGIGWKYVITRKWTEGNDTQAAAFVDIEMYIKDSETGQWSEAIPGTGGAVYKRVENSGKLYLDDDCFKKATTDALSVACKVLGIGADVYWQEDNTKYTSVAPAASEEQKAQAPEQKPVTRAKRTLTPESASWASNVARVASCSDTVQQIHDRITRVYDISEENFKRLIKDAGRAAA